MTSLTVNGTVREVDVEPDTPLLWVMREQLGLTGTKYGCGIAQCGACTVHVDGEATRSCRCRSRPLTADQKIVTIEGLSRGSLASGAEGLDRSSTCRSAATASPARSWPPPRFSADNPKPSDDEIDPVMTNICRCGTYNRIKAAMKLASELG